ncbi:class I SAM-dependent methyltransferase [Halobacillus locisalis]|uniref:Class I SAM-dependent methyltransferase n=1 Tax=Halobacillus locisalis TaxID=220753 RepID=A0A838CNW9_9BACI|nr:class I SAM-dependent methyltransferase [Halobacillus locisalis]MBA2173710.1 class I SAM-dependent methyltransferase [Halobacillus locisalis]
MVKATEHNSQAWDQKVKEGSPYTRAVSSETIQHAKSGNWEIGVTADKRVPREWFPRSLKGKKILCLASGGGQQGPVLAAAGAEVTVVDISKEQLKKDEAVAERDELVLTTMVGEMADLSMFPDGSFDMIIHPVSNVFVEDVRPVWKEASRVLKDQGILISGFMNPVLFLFDDEKEQQGILDVKYSIPYSSLEQEGAQEGQTLEFGHTLEDQIQGQTDAGFVLTGFYEDDFGGGRTVDQYMKTMIATKAVKLSIQEW